MVIPYTQQYLTSLGCDGLRSKPSQTDWVICNGLLLYVERLQTEPFLSFGMQDLIISRLSRP